MHRSHWEKLKRAHASKKVAQKWWSLNWPTDDWDRLTDVNQHNYRPRPPRNLALVHVRNQAPLVLAGDNSDNPSSYCVLTMYDIPMFAQFRQIIFVRCLTLNLGKLEKCTTGLDFVPQPKCDDAGPCWFNQGGKHKNDDCVLWSTGLAYIF